jgi:hypothetical protein
MIPNNDTLGVAQIEHRRFVKPVHTFEIGCIINTIVTNPGRIETHIMHPSTLAGIPERFG